MGHLQLLILALAVFCVAARRDGHPSANIRRVAAPPRIPVEDNAVFSPSGEALPPLNTLYTFDQLIDHDDPSKGTFEQRFYFSAEWYQPGGPIILFTPGEVPVDGYEGYLTNASINGVVMQQNKGAGVVLEHRFFGFSNPGPDLTGKTLSGLLNVAQATADLVYFANNVQLPMPSGALHIPPQAAPWLLFGGSYSGALVSWTMNSHQDVFWAGYASSAVVEAITYFWGYFEPIRQNAPKNCTADVEAVITYIDEVFTHGPTSEIDRIKSLFGLEEMTHLDDVAGALRSNLFDWQAIQPADGPGDQFFNFCDALEVKDGVSASASGWGLEHALNAWGNYWQTFYLNLICEGVDVVDCLGTYDPTQSFYANTSINQFWRSWEWFICNEVGWLQDGAPPNWPTLVTRLITPIYDERQCTYFFPDVFSSPPTPNTQQTNSVYRGWQSNVDRLFFATGRRDPWREATVSTDFAFISSTLEQPIAESDGFHCSDLIIPNNVDPTVLQVQNLGSAFMSKWVDEWHAANPSAPNPSKAASPDPTTLPKPVFSPEAIPSSIQAASPSALPLLPVSSSTASNSGGSIEGSIRKPVNVDFRDPGESK